MLSYWVLFHAIHETEINRELEGRRREYKGIPAKANINEHDVVFLFRGDEYLYGWGTILGIGRPYREGPGQEMKDIYVDPRILRQKLVLVEDIKQNPVFRDFTWTGRNSPLWPLTSEQ